MPMLILWFLAAPALAATAQPARGTDPYFPPAFAKPSVTCVFGASTSVQPVVDDFENSWYSGHLSAAKEPSLYAASLRPRETGRETLRFTWLPSFHQPVVVRIEWSSQGGPRLIAKQLSGRGGYAPESVSKQIDRALSRAEAGALRAEVARVRIWDMPVKDCPDGTDGAQWLMEGVDAKGYHFVDRWSPKQGGVHDLGMALLRLTGWRFKTIY